MAIQQNNFVLVLENTDSPIIITVPHGGMSSIYGSWLESLYEKRSKSENKEENIIQGERIVTGGDNNILHIVMDIIKEYPANVIVGLLPRGFVDYNRFVPEVAYADKNLQTFYQAYHQAIDDTIKRLKENPKFSPTLFDFHGFGKQPMNNREFDIILGTNGESTPARVDRYVYDFLPGNYEIFCANMDGLPEENELYKGDTTNLYYYKKHNIDALLVEIAPKFRSSKIANAKENGEKLAKDWGIFFQGLDAKLR